MNLEMSILVSAGSLILVLIGFFITYIIINKVYLKIKDYELFDVKQYFPEDEIHTLRQVFYLIIIACCITYVVISLFNFNVDIFYHAVFDFVLSLYCFINFKKDTTRNKIIAFFLTPIGSISYLLSDSLLLFALYFIHIIVIAYMVKVYYDKFQEYTRYNKLGFAIILLFSIVFISMYLTAFVENVSLLDSLVMSSNAFTSNGYAILGKSVPGKIDAIVLVWSGYILSGVSTATLTAAILSKHFNRRLDKMEQMIEEINKK